jgi:Gpi18-like mannosyltransferase
VRRALPAYAFTRLVLIIAVYFGFVLFTAQKYQVASVGPANLFTSLDRWDALHYLHIAQFGYTTGKDTAFLPLYPLLIRAVAVLTMQHYYLAGLIASNGALLVALATLYLLVREDFSEAIAQRTMVYLLLFPTAVFLSAPYNESLFLALVLQFFYQLQRRHWWVIALLGALAAATRTAGILLVVPLLVEFLQQRPWTWRGLLRTGIVAGVTCLGLVLYALYCHVRFGDALIFSQVQKEYWDRSLLAPWTSLGWGMHALVAAAPASFFEAHSFLDLGATVAFVILLIYGWRHLRPSYNWFVVAMLGLFLLFPDAGLGGLAPLQSNQRFMLELFPGFIALALWAKTSTRQTAILVLFSGLFMLLTTVFVTGRWLV